MFTFLRWLYTVITGKRHQHPTTTKVKEYPSQQVAYPFALTVFVVLALQSLLATGGALDLVIPNLPVPISYQAGRAIHLNFSILWPLIGLMGASYYVFTIEAERDLIAPGLAKLQFWIIMAAFIGTIATLALGYTTGREYLEALLPFKVGIAVSIAIFLTLLITTYLQPDVPKNRPTLLAPILGTLFSLLLFLPNIPFISNPVVDEAMKFWVVHLWEEGTLELVVEGVVAALFVHMMRLPRHSVDTLVWLTVALVALTGFLATGHHYYWIGMPHFWQWVGAAFSVLQITPFFLLAYVAYNSVQRTGWANLSGKDRVCFGLIFSSVGYHLLGAGMLGLALVVPEWSKLAHGTYLVSLHAHTALFGALGMLVLGCCYFVICERNTPTDGELKWAWRGLIGLNVGLGTMSIGLGAAGLLQAYMRYLPGIEFTTTMHLVRPYLALRGVGGGLFALGACSIMWSIGTMVWRERRLAPPFQSTQS